jgi:hypothetical protein
MLGHFSATFPAMIWVENDVQSQEEVAFVFAEMPDNPVSFDHWVSL